MRRLQITASDARPGQGRREDEVMVDAGFSRDRLWTVAEVAEHMRVSNMTVYRLIRSGQLAAIRVGKNYRIRDEDLSGYLDSSFTGNAKVQG